MLKSKNSRRKTLSHMDIESFLCDLGSGGEVEPAIDEKPIDENLAVACNRDSENVPPRNTMKSMDLCKPVVITTALNPPSTQTTVNESRISPGIIVEKVPDCDDSQTLQEQVQHLLMSVEDGEDGEDGDTVGVEERETEKENIKSDELYDEQLIRRFCQELYKTSSKELGVNENEDLISLSLEVHRRTQYNLISSRLMYPDHFTHPPSSVQGKKEVNSLFSLSTTAYTKILTNISKTLHPHL